jgi:hypothetical protein
VPNRYRRLLADHRFLYLLITGATSFAAPTGTLVVLLWAIPHAYAGTPNSETHGALALALLGLSSTIPTLAAAAIGGTLADRWDRRKLMRSVNLVALVATIGIALDLVLRPAGTVTVGGYGGLYLPVWVLGIYPLWAAETTAVTIFRPAFNASLPRLVSRSDLGSANGLVYATALLLSVGASLGAAGSVEFVGAGLALGLPILLFAITQVAAIRMQGDFAPPRDQPKRRFLSDAAEGYRFLWQRRELFEITLTALAINFLNAVAFVELGLYVTFWLGLANALFVGLMLSGASLGAAVGTIVINRLGFERRAGRFLIVLTTLQGTTVLALGLTRSAWFAIPDMFLFGLFPGMFTTVFLATIQATVPDHKLGRVFAADEVGSYSLIPVGQYSGGLLTVAAGLQVTYITAGVGTMAVGGLMATLPELRRLSFAPTDEPPAEIVPPPGATGEGLPS